MAIWFLISFTVSFGHGLSLAGRVIRRDVGNGLEPIRQRV